MRLVNITVVATAVMLLQGCAAGIHGGTYMYSGPGTFQEFAQARYQCVKESRKRVSGAFVNQYGGSSSSNVGVDCNVMDACLGAKGYFRNPNGNLDASSIPVQCY